MEYIFYFVITIGILVFIHEFGHFIAAKISGMQTDVFAIGFGKRLFGWNKVNGFTFGALPKDFDLKGFTDYRVSLLPLGGYVKIAGMIDESFDTEFASEEPQPYEFRAKPTYKKLFVLTAGVLMNLLLTVVIFWGNNYFRGDQVILTNTIGVITPQTTAYELGFRTGDKIIKINGESVNNWNEITEMLYRKNPGQNASIEILRNDNKKEILVPRNFLEGNSKKRLFLPYNHTMPFIAGVIKNSPAEESGLKEGDKILSINNTKVNTSSDVVKIISSNKEKDIPVVFLRGNDTLKITINPGIEGKIGIRIADVYVGPTKFITYGFFESLVKSFQDILRYTELTFLMLKNVITGKVAFGQVFGGPIKIAQFAAKSADSGLFSFLFFLAMLSLSLAIINILPFPGLDGGHFVIVSIEGILRRELPIKVKIAIQNTGVIILLLLMAFIIYSDLMNL